MSLVSFIQRFSKKKILYGILIISFFITLSYAFYFRIHPVVDAQAYDQIALNLLQGCGFKEDCSRNFLHDPAITRAGPAYEFFLAGIYGVFGHHYEVVWIIQALLHVFTAYLLFLSAKHLFPEKGEKVGLIAAFAIAFHPDLIEIAAMLMTETFYLFFISLFIYLFARVYRDPARSFFSVLLGVVTGVTILSRPPVMLFIPVVLCVYFLKKRLRQGLFFLIFLLLTLTPWTLRNYRVFDTFIPTTLIGEYNLWVGNTLESDGGQLSEGFNPVANHGEFYGFATLSDEAKRQFIDFVFMHPGRFIELCSIRFITYFSLIRPMGFWFYQAGLSQATFVALSGISIAALFIFGFAGLFKLFREKKELYYYFVALAVTAPILLIPTVVQSRYRFQIYPFLALSAGYLLARYRDERKSARSAIMVTLVVLGIITLIDVFLFRESIVEHIHTLFS